MGTLVRVENVSKTYGAAEGGVAVPVLRNVSLSAEQGESLSIIGPSGSGKSTLLNIIGTLDQPDSGRVWLDGEEIEGADEAKIAELRNRKVGFIFQAHHLLPHCTVFENVLVPALPANKGRASDAAQGRAQRLLQRVGLAERLHHRPSQLSGGERQRVAVVRALINEPLLLLADEPTGALDRKSAEELARLLRELNQEEKVTLIVVTHSLDLAGQMQRAYELREGELKVR